METVDVKYIGSDDQYQTYSPQDTALINTVTVTGNYGAPNDYIEYFIKDLGGVVLDATYNAIQYNIGSNINPKTGATTQLYLDPETDVKTAGYGRGSVNIKYNFFSKQLLSAPPVSQNFWIKEVSTSRTEIKVARQDLSNTELQNAFGEFNAVLAADPYYPTFLLNFGADIQIIGVNAVYIEEGGNGYIVFKLYEPLPTQFDVKSTFWVVRQVADSAEFNITVNVAATAVSDTTPLNGANFKVSIKDKVGQTTPYYSYASLLTTSVTSSYQQLKSMMEEKGIQINVDYSDFNNFVHFSSATERLYNFVYKIQQIESASLGLTQTNTDTAKVLLQSQINSIITNFDGYEYYLYFDSGSTAWPKQTRTQPYPLYSVTSSQAINWLGGINTVPNGEATMSMYFSASYYDDQNKDLLLHATPAYVAEDPANQPYLVFLNMIGQHFDNIWIYLKDVTNHYSAENNPFVGISMDQVADALRSFGVQLYTNTSITDNVYYSLLGINQTGSALPVTSSAYSVVNVNSSSLYPLAGQPYLTASLLLPPFAEEKINRYVITFVTGSNGYAFNTLPSSQIQNEVYKRIYHNLPYLLKTRGTERGIKALITTYGIPSDIMNVNEYGGYNYSQYAGIQEINYTPISTGSLLNISSSLLSPYTTLQYYQYTTEKTSNTVEVAFSPADSINASITSSGLITSSAQPGYFNIMQYIGAPNLQYSSSYTPLVQLSNNFFSSTYTQRYNVWDFIRVIKYYNNSLFKMIRDWVPARASADTGIVVKSHMLERNKYARHEPLVVISGSISGINMISITGSAPGGVLYKTTYSASVPVQYQSNSLYLATASGYITQISTTGIENFTGQYSGSTIDIPNEFPQVGVSSYIYPWTSSVPSTAPSGNIMFTTYSLNYLLNNVTGSVVSQRFLDLDYNQNQIVPTNFNLITQSLSQSLVIGPISQSQQPYSEYAQIQDYNYNLRRSIIPRYSGSYLSGLYYNVYTPQQYTYSGDISYGNSPVINYYSEKLGLFTQIETSSFIPGAVNASLAYFADVSGGLSELNQNNKNWQDLQNIFVAGDTLTVKQFDNKKYSNQVGTDGIKTIYSSGYNYTPQLYFLSGSDSKIYFKFLGSAVVDAGFTAVNGGNGGTNYYITGSGGTNWYKPNSGTGYIYNIFDSKTAGTGYTYGSDGTTTFPRFSPSSTEVLTFNSNFSIGLTFLSNAQTGTFTFDIKKNNVSILPSAATQTFTSTQTPAVNGQMTVTPINSSWNTFINVGTIATYTAGTVFDMYIGSAYQETITVAPGKVVSIATYSYKIGGVYSGTFIGINTAVANFDIQFDNYSVQDANRRLTTAPIPPTGPVNNVTATLNFNVTSPAISLAPSDVVTFELHKDALPAGAVATINAGSLSGTVTTVGQGGYPWADTWFIDSISDTSQTTTITFTSNLSQYYTYQQVPAFISASVAYTSSLYYEYGDINYPFNPVFGDKLIVRDYGGTVQDLTVLTSSFSSGTGKLSITLIPKLLDNWAVNSKLIYKFLLLKRYDDEQNVILQFIKNPGVTSYGFLIPSTISPQVTNNINTLQAAVQSQLLNTQAIPAIDTISGGTFS